MSKTALPLLCAAALGLLLAALPAAAQTPSDESLNRLIELQNITTQMRNTLPATVNIAYQRVARYINDHTRLSSKQRAELEHATERYVNDMNREVLQSEEVLSEIRRINRDAMRQIYTQEEVDAMIAFNSSPLGQSIMRKQSTLLNTVLPSMARLLSQRYEQAGQRLTPQFQREVERIMGSGSGSNGAAGKRR
ncbi:MULTISPECIES: DUF2059 domain-containing protein [Eikenella]|uniref:DUF2059 domain-containing protein n=1 Tax=Eikenella longinqua TaxID=1795827 RepID=A0A1A9RX02_9NEIS|nr:MULTISPECIES: DUF2059 domain-containing protein [Eikenella]OAM29272.1 hypothetical protein A7P95_03400 [Eikenella longinqua]